MTATDPAPENGANGATPVTVVRPWTVRWTLWASIAWGALTFLTALTLWRERPFVRQNLIDANNRSKHPVANYDADAHVSSALLAGTLQYALMGLILAALGLIALRGRGWARWLLVGFGTVIPVVVQVFGVGILIQLVGGLAGSAPGLTRVTSLAAGLCSLAVVVMLLLPASQQYFALFHPPGRRGLLSGSSRAPAGGARVRTGPVAPARAGQRVAPRVRPPGISFGSLFGHRAAGSDAGDGSVPDASISGGAAAGSAADGVARGVAPKRASATRPGSVKPKGTGIRTGRSKSRQE